MSDNVPNHEGGQNQKGGLSLFLNLAGDLLDKLTDVLNFGRILSIGLPGFVATYGLLMLLSLFSAPMPARWAVTSGATSDTIDVAPLGPQTMTATEAAMAVAMKATDATKATGAVEVVDTAKATARDTVGQRKIAVLSYYEQNHRVRLLNFIDRSRFQFDSSRIISQWYFWLFWFIGSIIIGSLISQWGYSNLRNRDDLFRIWNEIIQSVTEFILKSEKPEEDTAVMATANKAAKVMFAKPRSWRGLHGTLEQLHKDNPKWPDYYELLVKLQHARDIGSDEPSWSMLHLPLLRQNMIASQGITYHDHLTKEYWRFTEFATNCPAAVSVFCLTLGLYFCSLSIVYPSQAWILGSILGGVGLVVYLIAYFWWNPNVAFTSFRLYMQARSGLITGLSLFPAKDPNVINPFQKMYTDCSRFQEWYCKHYRDTLSVKDNAACKGPTTCLPGSANDTAEKAQPAPKAAAQPQISASAQVGGADGGKPRN